MDEAGPETIGEEALRGDKRRFKIVSIIAAVVCVPFVLTHLTFATVIPTYMQMYGSLGGELPFATKVLLSLSHFGILAVLLVVIDVALFVLMYLLAKRYWIGLLFVPIPIYIAISSILTLVLYMPMFNIITLIK